jgi:hypothetical protein
MRAWKFLKRGAIGPVSGFRWPLPSTSGPSAWVETEEAPAICVRGVHACRAEELGYWVNRELWELELDGDVIEGPECVIAPRGRLVRRIEAWSDGGDMTFVRACTDRLRERSSAPGAERFAEYVQDIDKWIARGVASAPAYICALICARIGVALDGDDEWSGFRRERAWQSQWIARQLIAA